MANMECREYQEQIVLFLYEELTDPEQTDLEAHLQGCGGCNDSFEQQKNLHAALAEDTGPWTIPSDLLVESRRALADELDRLERKRSWWRLPAFSVAFTPIRLLEWTTLVAVGLAAGVYVDSSLIHAGLAQNGAASAPLSAAATNGADAETVSNLRIVNSDAATGNVELVGDMVRPMHFSGNVQDETAQKLLMGALRDGRNPSSRISAVEVLSRKPDNREVKEALMRALIQDDNAGVRLKALESLKPFANQDKEVQSAFMNVLAFDDNSGIRVQAIEALKRFANDDSVARDVQEATKNDDNTYIKLQAIQFVGNRQ
jgi:hypothetical protein